MKPYRYITIAGKHQIPFATGMSVFALAFAVGILGVTAGALAVYNKGAELSRMFKIGRSHI